MRILKRYKRGRFFISPIFGGFLGSLIFYLTSRTVDYTSTTTSLIIIDYRRRPECSCSRSELLPLPLKLPVNDEDKNLAFCSHYATRRGPHQRVISISLFGPKENKRFQLDRSITFLNELIHDLNTMYPDNFVLRIHHDDTISPSDVICPIECRHRNVDFCNMNSKLFIPPKIWRFIPAGDPLVDVMMSRDLDSPLTRRERVAVNAWLASKKLIHAMRDHPKHKLRMLGGMWGIQPALNRSLAHSILLKIHDRQLITNYRGAADQTFLADYLWSYTKFQALVHDSFHCLRNYGPKPEPFPTQRPSANETNCFVGCVRSCCGKGKMPFGECPKECRPKDHPEWIYC